MRELGPLQREERRARRRELQLRVDVIDEVDVVPLGASSVDGVRVEAVHGVDVQRIRAGKLGSRALHALEQRGALTAPGRADDGDARVDSSSRSTSEAPALRRPASRAHAVA